jgi:hypothetical protein
MAEVQKAWGIVPAPGARAIAPLKFGDYGGGAELHLLVLIWYMLDHVKVAQL